MIMVYYSLLLLHHVSAAIDSAVAELAASYATDVGKQILSEEEADHVEAVAAVLEMVLKSA